MSSYLKTFPVSAIFSPAARNMSQGKRKMSSRIKATNHAKNNSWPSEDHRCITFYHASSMPLTDLKSFVERHGTVVKSHTVPMAKNLASTFEMSDANEALLTWKAAMNFKLDGVCKVFPDREHTRIISYPLYWSFQKVQEGLNNDSLICGNIRINPRMFQHAYISDGENPDILIDSVLARNRALPGDIVVVKVRDASNHMHVSSTTGMEAGNEIQEGSQNVKLADVVYILEKRHSRVCVGMLAAKRDTHALFRPIDNCLPRLLIPIEQCPPEYLKNQENFHNKVFVATIEEWSENSTFAIGNLHQIIGKRGEIETETERILIENGVDVSEFPEFENCGLSSDTAFNDRRDLRSECVFTIDPTTAKDLDDALHCRKIAEDRYEVGVHIADVSHYVPAGSEIDEIASRRCTSIYLVQKVIPMLPPELSEKLCSLNPGQDKLTYSVIWEMSGQGEILKTWFGRTVIRSCAKLAYDHAQDFIDNPDDELEGCRYPDIQNVFELSTVRNKVLRLHTIAQFLRQRRCDNGALRLDQIKLSFTLDGDTGMPNSCYQYNRQSSNELVEEFMLLANISVAQKLKESLPHHAFLRCHPSPKLFLMKKIAGFCNKHGIKLDVSSSGNLAASIRDAETNSQLQENCVPGLLHYVTKPQELALYFCTGCVDDEKKYHHYALNVPLYTHFTSPIRRYADILVHRQLTRIQQGHSSTEMVNVQPTDLQKQANMCNIRKASAKKVQDASIQLFFYAMIKSVGNIHDKAVVLQVYDHSIDVLALTYGQISRIYMDNLPLVKSKYNEVASTMEIIWPCIVDGRYKLTSAEMNLAKLGKLKLPEYSSTVQQQLSVFSTVDVIFEACEDELKIRTFLQNPSISVA